MTGASVTARTGPTERAGPAALVELASARWPAAGDDPAGLPQIAGFVVSSFNPLVAQVAERCLLARHGAPPADPAVGDWTAVVLASQHGDTVTAHTVADAVQAGRRVQPLLFFQSNPNAVVGHVASRWGLRGPVVCTSPTPVTSTDTGDGAMADGLAVAELLIAGRDAVEVLVITADQAAPGSASAAGDLAAAVLVTAAAAKGRP